MSQPPAVWFPTIQAGTGSDVFTIRLAEGLRQRGMRAEITWLPHRAEYLPWTVAVPKPPEWANVVHVNSVMHQRFVPHHLPVVVTIHSNVHDPAFRFYKSFAQSIYHRLWIKPVERRGLDRANCAVAVSHYTASRVKGVFGDRRIEVIHNGVPGDTSPLDARSPHVPFRLLYVGGWRKLKGVDLLAPIMRELGAEFELWFTGDVQAERAQRYMPDNCKCIGWLPQHEMQGVYRMVDALLFPTRLEGFGLVAAEAIAHHVPVVASKVCSLPEVVNSGEGILCDFDDVSSFVRGARAVRDEWARYRAACYRSRYQFSMERMVDEYIERYQALV